MNHGANNPSSVAPPNDTSRSSDVQLRKSHIVTGTRQQWEAPEQVGAEVEAEITAESNLDDEIRKIGKSSCKSFALLTTTNDNPDASPYLTSLHCYENHRYRFYIPEGYVQFSLNFYVWRRYLISCSD